MEVKIAKTAKVPKALKISELKTGSVYRHPDYGGLYLKTSLRLGNTDNALVSLDGGVHNTEPTGWILVDGYFYVEGDA